MIDWEKLSRAAQEARESAYAPYSKFKVGAAVLCADGSIIKGCNVENASFGLTNCAERTALFAAVAQEKRDFSAMAIFADTEQPIAPCGACRQVMAELAPQMEVRLLSKSGKAVQMSASELLPQGFDGSFLETEEEE